MGGVCARQFCSAPSIARVDFDGEARVVWIDDLGEHKPAAACCLCRRHADTLTPPRNWELRDLRSKAQSPVEQSPVERSTLVTIPNEPPPVPEPASAPVAVAAEASPAWSPRLFASVDTGSVLDATSPLLSRAFHGVR
ncbi:MAG: DUF3499 family protein [Acidimicrobiia bacterium]